MHLHFFAKVAEIARAGDFGCFITAAEWLDVGYGSALRSLLADGLGGAELHVVEPAAEAFPGTMTTAAITAFAVGRRPAALIAAGEVLDDLGRLRQVVDVPPDLGMLPPEERDAVARFLAWAKSAGAAEGYIARHRTPWWAVRLADPAPIVCTYMARRPPAFVRNRAGARLLNIAHGLYPREPLSEAQLMALVRTLQITVNQSSGRTYSGGLTKFEPRTPAKHIVSRRRPQPRAVLR